MTFAEPMWLFGGAAGCAALLWLYRGADVRRRADLARFAAESLIGSLTRSLSPARRSLKRVLLACGVAAIAAALARPQWGFRWEESHRKGLDILFAVDTSKSMLAQDVKPDRLTRAKMAVEDLLEKLGGDRVGLIAFSGSAFLQCPMTCDYDAFRQSLDAIDAGIIPRGGTDMAGAIREALLALEGKSGGERILILLTDGEDLEGGALDAAREAAKDGMKIFAVGVGSAAGELIPVPDGRGGTAFARDRDGQFVKSRLDDAMLRRITETTGGRYEPLGAGAAGLDAIYERGLAAFARHDVASRMHKVPLERFQWPLAAGLICLVIEPLIGLRRRRSRAPGARRLTVSRLLAAWNRLAHRAAAACAVAVVLFGGRAHGSAGAGDKAYREGDFPRAAEAYGRAAEKNPDKPLLRFNLGAASYKSGEFDAAADAFAKALKTDDVRLQQDDYYNLGNTRFRIGQRTEKSDAAKTIEQWEQAVQHYEAALQIRGDDEDARFNRDLVKRKIEELKKQQEQQQQQNPDQQKQDDQKQQQDQNQKQQSQDDQQQKQDQQKQNDPQQQQGQNPDQQKQDDQGQQQDQNQKQQGQDDQQQKQDQQKQNDPQQQNQRQQPQDQQASKQDRQQEKEQAGKPQEPQQQQGEKGGEPAAQNPPPEPDKEDRAEAQAAPGEMSREEARQLLDSLRDNERRLPMAPYVRGGKPAQEREPLRDW